MLGKVHARDASEGRTENGEGVGWGVWEALCGLLVSYGVWNKLPSLRHRTGSTASGCVALSRESYCAGSRLSGLDCIVGIEQYSTGSIGARRSTMSPLDPPFTPSQGTLGGTPAPWSHARYNTSTATAGRPPPEMVQQFARHPQCGANATSDQPLSAGNPVLFFARIWDFCHARALLFY